MSAVIHTVSSAQFKAMGDEARAEFLGEVASEFLTKEGRGRNIKTVVVMPTSYAVLYGRRVRQLAKMAGIPTETAAKVVIEVAKTV